MREWKRRALALVTLIGPVALPASASCAEPAVAARGQTVRLTSPQRIEIPGVLTLEGGRRLATGSVREESGGALLVVESEGRMLHVPVPGRPLVGQLVTVDERSVTVSRDAKQLTVPREAIESLAVRTGHPSRWRGAGFGALIGFGVGAAIGFAAGDDPEGTWFGMSAGEKAVGLGGLLAIAGTLVGVAVAPGERWEVVDLGTVRVSCGPVLSRRGPGLALTLAF